MNGSDPGPFVKNQLKTNSSLQPFRKIADLYFYANAKINTMDKNNLECFDWKNLKHKRKDFEVLNYITSKCSKNHEKFTRTLKISSRLRIKNS